MPDMQHFDDGPCPDEGMAQRLRGLPERPPGDDGWPRLALALRRVQPAPPPTVARLRRWSPGLAMAAMLLLALLWPCGVPEPPVDALVDAPTAAVDPAEATTAALIAQSQWLENLVAAPLLAPDVQDSDQVLLDWGLRQRIAGIDNALQVADAGQRQPLWQARVDALSQLVQVRWAGARQTLDTGVADGGALQQAVMWSN